MISLETPRRKWASSRLEGRTSWNFSSGGRCSRLTTGTTGTRSGGLGKGQSPCELLGSLSGFLSRRFRGLRPRVELVPEPEDSSPATRRNRALLGVGRTLVLPLELRRVCRVNSCVAVRLRRTLWTLQRLGVISVETPQQKWASSRLEGRTSWNFSSCCMC